MFTDGISEAMNVDGIDYTEERVEEFLRNIGPMTAQGVLDEIQNEIARGTLQVRRNPTILRWS